MNDIDQEIIDKADAWEEKKHKLERERLHLRHDRRVKWFRYIVGITVIGAIAAFSYAVWPAVSIEWNEFWSKVDVEQEAAAQVEAVKEQKIREVEIVKIQAAKDHVRARKQVWVDCVNTFGLETCELINERAYRLCLRKTHAETYKCVSEGAGNED